MKTLQELEQLPLLKNHPNKCMRCEKSIEFCCNEIIVYRCPIRGNVSFETARFDDSVEEIVVAEVCLDCGDELYL